MYLENRLIAMLDVLGFGNRIDSKDKLLAIAEEYSALISEAKTYAFAPKPVQGSPQPPRSNFEVGEFIFDTIVLVSYPISPHTVKDFIFSITLLMEKFHARTFPLRGAISIGNFYANEDSGVFLSDTFKRLSKDGNQQEWAGCVIQEDAEKIVLENLLGAASSIKLCRSTPIQKYIVPYKKAQSLERWCLNWPFFLSENDLNRGVQFLEGNAAKSENTKAFLTHLLSLEDDTASLGEEFKPAVKIRISKATTGMRIRFEDNSTNSVVPHINFNIVAQ